MRHEVMIKIALPLDVDVDDASKHGNVGEVLARPLHDVPDPEHGAELVRVGVDAG